jgi:hypothetical protein
MIIVAAAAVQLEDWSQSRGGQQALSVTIQFIHDQVKGTGRN